MRKAVTSFLPLFAQREDGCQLDGCEDAEKIENENAPLVVLVDERSMTDAQSVDEQRRDSQTDQTSEDAARPECESVDDDGDGRVHERTNEQAKHDLHLRLRLLLVVDELCSPARHEVHGQVDKEGQGEEGDANERRQDVLDEDGERAEPRRERDGSRRIEGRWQRNLREGGVLHAGICEVSLVRHERLLEAEQWREGLGVGEEINEPGNRTTIQRVSVDPGALSGVTRTSVQPP